MKKISPLECIVNLLLIGFLFSMALANFASMRQSFFVNLSYENSSAYRALAAIFSKLDRLEGKQMRLSLSNFQERLTLTDKGFSLHLPLIQGDVLGHIDSLKVSETEISLSGWVYARSEKDIARFVVMTHDFNVIAVGPVNAWRPDVSQSLGEPAARNSGFFMVTPFANASIENCRLGIYTVFDSMQIHRMSPACDF